MQVIYIYVCICTLLCVYQDVYDEFISYIRGYIKRNEILYFTMKKVIPGYKNLPIKTLSTYTLQ